MLRWTLGYTCLFPFWFPQCVCPAVGLLDHKAVLFSEFLCYTSHCSQTWFTVTYETWYVELPQWFSGKKSACNAGDCLQYRIPGFDPWIGKSPWRRTRQPTLQYSCLENPMDSGAWQATVHRVAKSQTQLND